MIGAVENLVEVDHIIVLSLLETFMCTVVYLLL